MPYKIDKMKLGKKYDRRRKLTPSDYQDIKSLYKLGTLSQYEIARKFNISRSMVQVIVNPERKKQIKQRNKEHWRDYYNTRNHNKTVANYRKYKDKLFKENKLIEEKQKMKKMEEIKVGTEVFFNINGKWKPLGRIESLTIKI